MPAPLRRPLSLPACLALLAVLVTACGSESGAPGDGSPSAGKDDAGSPSASPAVSSAGSAFEPSSAPRSLGPGVVVGISRDGTAAYVIAEKPGSNEVGCEGVPAQFLFSVPLDGTPRKLATEAFQPINGALRRSPDGSRLSIAEYCEEFFVRLLIASERPGGMLGEIKELKPKGDYEVYNALTWAPDSKSFISSAVKQAGSPPFRDLVRIDAGSGEVAVLEKDTDAISAVELSGGAMVTITSGKKLIVGNDEINFEGFNISVSPDTKKAVVFGQDGVVVVEPSKEPQFLKEELAFTGEWTPDSKAVFYNTKQGHLLLTVLGGKTTRLAEGAQYGPGAMTPDGRRLVYTYEPAPGETPSPPTVRVLDSK